MQRESMSMRLALVALEHLNLRYSKECHQIPMFAQLKTSYESVVSFALIAGGGSKESEKARAVDRKYKQAVLELIDVQRTELIIARRESTYDHELTLETEDQLNLEEARLTRTEAEPSAQPVSPGSESVGPDYHVPTPGARIVNPTSRLIDPSEFVK
jgi:phosphoribosyl-dephospho-CoA transferase